MKKVLTVGGATQDIFITLNNPDALTLYQKKIARNYFIFEAGKKIEAEQLSTYVGGGAANTAASFTKLDIPASSYCTLGTDTQAAFILEYLRKMNIDSSLVHQQEALPTATSYIIDSDTHDESIFVHRGANELLDLGRISPEVMTDYSHLYFTSLGKKASQQLDTCVKQAKQSNTLVTINPGSSQLSKGVTSLKAALQHTDVFIVNADEAKLFMMALIESDETYLKALESRTATYCPPDAAEKEACLLNYPMPAESLFFSIRNYFKEVLKMGPEIVIITNGANGVYVANKQNIYFHPSVDVQVIDTVGAGDAFGSTFTAARAKGTSLEDALRCAMVNSAAVIEKIGAQVGQLDFATIEKRVAQLDQKLLEIHGW